MYSTYLSGKSLEEQHYDIHLLVDRQETWF